MKKIFVLLTLSLFLLSGVAMAKMPAKSASKGGVFDYSLVSKDSEEGFEGAFPPVGWTVGVTLATNTWFQDFVSFYEGAAAAHVVWQDVEAQDETMSFDVTVVAGDALSFWTMGSVYWATNANFTVEIDGNLEYDWATQGLDNFVWEEVIVDLAAYVGQTVTITFRYAGLDGADHHLDYVRVGEYETPPPPPPVSFCEYLIEADGSGMFYGDTCDGMNLIEALGCESYSEAGLEDYYEVFMPTGSSFTATVTNTADGALWVVGECEAEAGAFTCLAYADDTLSGDAEVITYTNAGPDAVVYLVIDSWGADSCGTYEMLFESTGGAIPNEDVSFSEIKALFR